MYTGTSVYQKRGKTFSMLNLDSIQTQARLLVVDDDYQNCELFRRMFERTCDVSVVHSGQEALDLLNREKFDVVLLDIMMPNMTGLEVLERLRGQTKLAELPVILISAISDRREILKGLRLGANDYVTKPVDLEVVQARVHTQIMLKRFVDERASLIAQLESANELRLQLMQIASHDLKNPLNNLRMIQRLLRAQLDTPERAVELLSTADETINTMLSVVEEFLDHRILKDSSLSVAMQAEAVAPLFEHVQRQYAVMAANKQIQVDVEPCTLSVMADASRLTQALGNLLNNALKYSPHKSHVRLRAVALPEERVRLEVQDAGPGVTAEDRANLFKPYGRSSAQPTGGEPSTGLGLWIVRSMIELQDGEVGVDDAPGGGSIFWITLRTAPETDTIPSRPVTSESDTIEAPAVTDPELRDEAPKQAAD